MQWCDAAMNAGGLVSGGALFRADIARAVSDFVATGAACDDRLEAFKHDPGTARGRAIDGQQGLRVRACAAAPFDVGEVLGIYGGVTTPLSAMTAELCARQNMWLEVGSGSRGVDAEGGGDTLVVVPRDGGANPLALINTADLRVGLGSSGAPAPGLRPNCAFVVAWHGGRPYAFVVATRKIRQRREALASYGPLYDYGA